MANDARSPSQTARVRSLVINRADTQNREWSSTPVNAFAEVPSANGNPPTTSICHNSMATPRSQRFHFRERRSRAAGSIIAARTNARYTADSDGTGATLRLANSNTSRRGPQYGRDRRNSNTAASTSAGI